MSLADIYFILFRQKWIILFFSLAGNRGGRFDSFCGQAAAISIGSHDFHSLCGGRKIPESSRGSANYQVVG